MEIIQLANTIRAVALGNYVPFQGFREEVIVARVQRVLPVTEHQIMVALEYIAQKGVDN
jgi:hypothetical protein